MSFWATVCFLDKWPQTKCKVTFDTSLLYSLLCFYMVRSLHFVFHGSFDNLLSFLRLLLDVEGIWATRNCECMYATMWPCILVGVTLRENELCRYDLHGIVWLCEPSTHSVYYADLIVQLSETIEWCLHCKSSETISADVSILPLVHYVKCV